MRFCLIVATLGRVEEVERLFGSLAAQTHRDFFVVLVDQNPDERLRPLIERFVSAMEIRHERVPSRGVSVARNVGFPACAEADLVAFPDDDCFYAPDTLARVAELFAAEPTVVGVMGRSEIPERAHQPSSAPPGWKVCDSRYWLIPGSVTYVQFFRRSVVEQVGGFDRHLGPGGGSPWLCGEDTDFLLRVRETGGRVIRCPSLRVFHPAVDATRPGYALKGFGYGRGRIAMLRRRGFPTWFTVLNTILPFLSLLWSSATTRGFRWHLFRGRLHELLHPHTPS